MMHLIFLVIALIGAGFAWPTTKPQSLQKRAVGYVDQDTGFKFSQTIAAATLTSNIIYRIAQPADIPSGQPYDIVLQVVAPNSLGWAGLAWGGSMIRNPLTVSYPNGNTGTVSSRWATAHAAPSAYTGATYTLLRAGTKTNSTHWQVTARCTGCTTYTGSSGAVVRLNPNSTTRFGFAAAAAKVTTPSSNTSTIQVHDVYNYITHDFSGGANADFAALLQRNGV